MRYVDKKAEDVKIAYIGGGSRGWAWGLMSDLVANDDMSGEVWLYDIDFEAAKNNEIIGNRYNDVDGAKSKWNYKAVDNIGDALKGADFVVISIMPATYKEMRSDVHHPEKYGIYQSVGDTTGPGGIIRALRTIPMFEEFAENIKKYCPQAWVINYTNPMALCVKALYDTFPEIKAFGCCHEIFGAQRILKRVVEELKGVEVEDRTQIKVNVLGVNHFTWLDRAQYKNIDLLPLYKEYCETYNEREHTETHDEGWINQSFMNKHLVKMDLFLRYGLFAAAGDRHLAEFCESSWYLANPERVAEMGFELTSVDWRIENHLNKRLAKAERLFNGEEELKIEETGEEGVLQMRALLGLCDLVTNVNLPNIGQIPNLPLGAVVETNAAFRANSVEPVMAGNIPENIYPLVSRVCGEQELVAKAARERNLELAYLAMCNDPLVTTSTEDTRKMFNEMVQNTKEYLSMYDLTQLK